MNWIFGFLGIALLIIGLIGQAFEMRKIRLSYLDEELGSANIFGNRKNFKWYAIITAGIISWFIAERI
ncbi:MAG: hypothetical protein OEL81_00845 [Nitrosopumilus sp.]|nr:hypothetical protein [Nitrosopumilus sp.]MDH3385971.1 hypothetical protein [Nitrosopumilus sp.]